MPGPRSCKRHPFVCPRNTGAAVRARLGSSVSVFNARRAYVLKTARQANDIFVDKKAHRARCDKFVIAGPGPLKTELAENPQLLPEIKKHIISVVDVGYGGVVGLAEAVRRSKSAIVGARYEEETAVLRELFSRIAKDDARYALGPDAMEALASGCAEKIIVGEKNVYRTLICARKSIDGKRAAAAASESAASEGTCEPVFFHVRQRHVQKKSEEIEARGDVTVIRVVEFTDWAIDHASSYGAEVDVLSTRGPDLVQFEKGFGGVAALTRYAFRPEADFEPTASDDGYSSSSDSDSDDSSGEGDELWSSCA